MKVLVAGGGIGGLAAAVAAARAGHQVEVLERRDVFGELGAGIQLGPNAFRALAELGVAGPVQNDAVHIDQLRLVDGPTGRLLVGLDLTGRYRRRFAYPYAVVARTDLHRALLEACRADPAVTLSTCRPVLGHHQDGSGVTVDTGSGSRVRGDVLVGADGLRSVTRAALVGDGPLRLSGHTIYRSVIAMDDVPAELRSNSVTLWAGPGWHFVHYPIASGRLLNLAATLDNHADQEVVGEPADRAWVLGQFAGLGPPGRRLLELGRNWRSWVLCDRDPVSVWVDRRVALLGDAAHPMLQYAAQGACMALEDAVVLGRQLRRPDLTVEGALRCYNTARADRAGRVQLVSRMIGDRLYHAGGAAAADRDALLAAMSVEDLLGAVDWLHGARRFDEAA